MSNFKERFDQRFTSEPDEKGVWVVQERVGQDGSILGALKDFFAAELTALKEEIEKTKVPPQPPHYGWGSNLPQEEVFNDGVEAAITKIKTLLT